MTEFDVVSDMHSCTILWSTQSGRAKACARRVARILREQTDTIVTVGGEVDEYAFYERISEGAFPPHHWWIFLISTTGDGEQCDSIQQTWKALLSKSLPKTWMGHHRFSLFSLGDRVYGPQFCAAGRKLAARLVQLGAKPVCGIGYGDDGTPNGGVFADLDVWLEKTLFPLLPKKSKANNVANSTETETKPAYRVIVHNDWQDSHRSRSDEEWVQETYQTEYQQFFAKLCPMTAYAYSCQSTAKIPLVGHVVSNQRITASSWDQDTRHLCIELNDTRHNTPDSLPYQAGDIATIFPVNSNHDVAALLQVLPKSIQSIADSYIENEINTNGVGSTPWPRCCTLRGLLTYCADIKGLPEREDLRVLSAYCDLQQTMGKAQRDKLLSLSDTSGAALYTDYILREKRSWADVLYDFDSIQLTVESLLTLLPTMRPRHFSIASAPSESQKKDAFHVELCVAIVEGTTPLGRSYHGLCSKYLAKLNGKALVRMWIRPGSFGKLPLQLDNKGRFDTPILCIGAGTGIAPLRSLILEREALYKKGGNRSVGISEVDQTPENLLVYGCRKESADFYYGDTWKTLVTEKRLLLWTAFSRDQWHKIYVQQVLRGADDGKLVEQHILEHGGAIYVAGGAKMARAVKEEVLECLTDAVGQKQATMLLKRLNQQGCYNVEAWS